VRAQDQIMKLRVASNSTTPGDVLTILSSDPSDEVRLLVAKNPATPHHVVAKLARDNARAVRLGLASDQHCPVELLSELADDADEVVRNAARNTRRALLPAYQHIFNAAIG
jgi:hypothetical protein